MKFWLTVMASSVGLIGASALAQGVDCTAMAPLLRTASARSVTELAAAAPRPASGYKERVAYAIRAQSLAPNSKTASSDLLSLLPKTPAQRAAWSTLADGQCAMTGRQLTALGALADEAPKAVSMAAIIDPAEMDGYVRFVLDESEMVDPKVMDSVASVCRARHSEFVASVARLPANDRRWLETKVFAPDGCRAIKLSEAK